MNVFEIRSRLKLCRAKPTNQILTTKNPLPCVEEEVTKNITKQTNKKVRVNRLRNASILHDSLTDK